MAHDLCIFGGAVSVMASSVQPQGEPIHPCMFYLLPCEPARAFWHRQYAFWTVPKSRQYRLSLKAANRFGLPPHRGWLDNRGPQINSDKMALCACGGIVKTYSAKRAGPRRLSRHLRLWVGGHRGDGSRDRLSCGCASNTQGLLLSPLDTHSGPLYVVSSVSDSPVTLHRLSSCEARDIETSTSVVDTPLLDGNAVRCCSQGAGGGWGSAGTRDCQRRILVPARPPVPAPAGV